jgi:DhnA family fructose-bisphosphate aldolase class Ia
MGKFYLRGDTFKSQHDPKLTDIVRQIGAEIGVDIVKTL